MDGCARNEDGNVWREGTVFPFCDMEMHVKVMEKRDVAVGYSIPVKDVPWNTWKHKNYYASEVKLQNQII